MLITCAYAFAFDTGFYCLSSSSSSSSSFFGRSFSFYVHITIIVYIIYTINDLKGLGYT